MIKKILKKNKIGLIILSRLDSKRLKNKAQEEINGINITEILILRLLKIAYPKNICLATCSSSKNTFYKKLTKKYKINYYEGPKLNVLSRIINASKKFEYNKIVRLTGDNPFIDQETLRNIILIDKKKYDYILCNNTLRGTRGELITIDSLNKLKKIILDIKSTEYLSYYFFRKEKFKSHYFKSKNVIKNENLFSISIDSQKDLSNIREIVKGKNVSIISRTQILKLIKIKKMQSNFKIKKRKFIRLKDLKFDVRLKGDSVNKKILNYY